MIPIAEALADIGAPVSPVPYRGSEDAFVTYQCIGQTGQIYAEGVEAETVAAALEGGFGHDAVEQDAAFVGAAPQALDAGLEGGLGEAFGDLRVEFGKRVRRRRERHHCGNLFRGDELHGGHSGIT